jgi:hypothetical protein
MWFYVKNIGIILLALVSFFCAGQYPPSGGPVDKTPPEVIATSPTPGTLRFHGDKIRIEFNKYIAPLKVQEAIFLSPSLGQLTYDWGWKDVEIHFSDSLRPNTTYIFTLGTDAEDTHGNKLAQSFALPFSTGEKIDSASITGRIYDPNPSGVMIFAFKLNGRSVDTLNPTHTKPDFLTQTGKDGTFSLTNLAIGDYRLIAVRDQYKNLLYDVQVDEYGVLPYDLSLPSSASTIANIQFKMTASDTSLPFLSSAKALTRTAVLLRFNKPMDPGTVTLSTLSIVDTISKQPLRVQDVSFTESSSEANLVTMEQESTKVYMASVVGAQDIHGNRMLPTGGRALFNGVAQRDTLKLSVKFMSGGDSLKNIDPMDTLWLTFSKPVIRQKMNHAVHLFDSSKNEVGTRMKWINSLHAVLQPEQLFYGEWYKMNIILDSLTDYDGKGFHDSVLVRHFSTISEQTMGNMRGEVVDEGPKEPGKIILLLNDIFTKNTGPRMLLLDSAGAFNFEHLREGKYSLWAYRDRDADGKYTFGDVFPYKPSERFTVYTDTLKIRARWPLEGVLLRLKKF